MLELKNISFTAKPGQMIAIVGPTGSGKTTLINLLMRFYDVDEGAITVDDNDIRELTRHSLRTSYGMVLQETWLKTGTIEEIKKITNAQNFEEAFIKLVEAKNE